MDPAQSTGKRASVPTEERQPSGGAHHSTPDADAAVVVRDLRGWFYRLTAPNSSCAVLQVGDGFAENWLPNVVKSDLREETIASLSLGQFDLVVMHYTLGGRETLSAAITSASRLLRYGGILAIAGENRLRSPGRGASTKDVPCPRATGWGFRSVMVSGGFTNVALFITHPPGNAPVYVVHADRLSAREFFRSNLRGRNLASWSPVRIALMALVELNVMPYLQPGLLVVGEKC